MIPRVSSYAWHLIVRSVLTAVVPLLILGALSYWYLSKNIKDTLTLKNEMLAERMVGEIQAVISRPLVVLTQLKYFVEARVHAPEEVDDFLDTTVRTSETFETIYVLDDEDKIIHIGLPADMEALKDDYLGLDMSGISKLALTSYGEDVRWSEVFLSSFSGRQCLFVSLKTERGALIGVFSITHIHDLIKRIDTVSGISLLVADQRGDLIFIEDDTMVTEHYNFSHLEPVRQALLGNYGTYDYRFTNGREFIGSSAGLPETGWVVIVAQEKEEAFRPIRQISFYVLAVTLLAIPLVTCVAYFMSIALLRPLKHFEANVKAIANGDYGRILGRQRFSEMESLAHHIRTMAGSISEREERLVESEEKYREIFNTPADALFIHDADNGTILEVNQTMLQMYGYDDPTEVLGQSIGIISAGSKPYREVDAAAILRKANEGQSQVFEWRSRRRDGQLFWVEVALKQVTISGEQRILAVARDINYRKEVESELVASENKYRALLGAVATVPWEIDLKSSRFVYVGQQSLEVFGYSPESWIDMATWAARVHPEDRESAVNFCRLSISRGEDHDFTYRALRSDGSTIWIHDIVSVVMGDDGPERLVGFMHDVSAVRLAEEEQEKLQKQLRHVQKMEAIGTLAGGVAHDFNNILAAILGYAELVRDELNPWDSSYEMVDEIILAATRAADVVAQILAFSRQKEYNHGPIMIHLVVGEVLKFIRASIPSTVAISSDIDKDCGMINGDPTQIHQVVMNLCTNAFQAMEESGGQLTVTLDSCNFDDIGSDIPEGVETTEGEYVRLTVADTGDGMGEDILERIFEPYFTTKESGKGSGMGLAVVHGIVKSHNGFIMVVSSPEEGASFMVYFPVVGLSEPDIDTGDEPVLPHGTEKILVVDDEPGVAEVTKARLERLGYRVMAKNSSREALDLFRRQPEEFDLLITDQTMPELTGVQLAGEMLLLKPGLPILLCTGYSAKVNKAEAKETGIRAFLMKPVSREELALSIRELLDGADQSVRPESAGNP